jgi:hypothetical protein
MATVLGLTRKEINDALVEAEGNLTATSKLLGCSRRTVYDRIRADPELKTTLDQIRESVLDLAENKLIAAVRKGESWAICFLLKCLAKDRGYLEKVQLELLPAAALEELSEDELLRIERGESVRNVLAGRRALPPAAPGKGPSDGTEGDDAVSPTDPPPEEPGLLIEAKFIEGEFEVVRQR